LLIITLFHSIEIFGEKRFSTFISQAAGIFTFISLKDVVHNLPKYANDPGLYVTLTFDDGYLDYYTKALPVLIEKKIPSTVFCIADFLGRKNIHGLPYLGKTHLREISNTPLCEIGSHSLNHPMFNKIDSNETDRQILHSKEKLQDFTGREVEFFAYPYSIATEYSLFSLMSSGYKAALCGHSKYYSFFTETSGLNLYHLGRYGISQRFATLEFLLLRNNFTRLGMLIFKDLINRSKKKKCTIKI